LCGSRSADSAVFSAALFSRTFQQHFSAEKAALFITIDVLNILVDLSKK